MRLRFTPAATRRGRAAEHPRHHDPPDPTLAQSGSTLHELIDTLEHHRREAFTLVHVHGLSYTEAARRCRCRSETIRTRVGQALHDLVVALDTPERAGGQHGGARGAERGASDGGSGR